MKVSDVLNIMNPWQDIMIKKESDTQLDEPLFKRDGLNIGAMPTDECMNLVVVGIDASWNEVVLLVANREEE